MIYRIFTPSLLTAKTETILLCGDQDSHSNVYGILSSTHIVVQLDQLFSIAESVKLAFSLRQIPLRGDIVQYNICD